nr:hypothetical protein [Tanacetum cinerariifolium]
MLKDSGAGVDKSVEELQVEVEPQGLNNHTLEEVQIDQEYNNDEDAGDQEPNQTTDLKDYPLVQDRELRTTTKPLSFQDEDGEHMYRRRPFCGRSERLADFASTDSR